jgi:hypothetical protein
MPANQIASFLGEPIPSFSHSQQLLALISLFHRSGQGTAFFRMFAVL